MNQVSHTGALEPVSHIEQALQKANVTEAVLQACEKEADTLTKHPFPDKAAFDHARRRRLDTRNIRIAGEKLLEQGKDEAYRQHQEWCKAENSFKLRLKAAEEKIAAAEQEFLTREHRMREEKQAAHDRAVADRKARLLAIDFLFNGQRYFYTLLDGTELGIDKPDIESWDANDIDFGTWLVQMEQEVTQDKAARAAKAEQEQAEQRRVEEERQELARLRAQAESHERDVRMLKRCGRLIETGCVFDDVERTYHFGSLVWASADIRDMAEEDFDEALGQILDEKRVLENESVRQHLAAVDAQRRQQLFDLGYSVTAAGWSIGGERAYIGPELAGYGDDLWEGMIASAQRKAEEVRAKKEREALIDSRRNHLLAAGWVKGKEEDGLWLDGGMLPEHIPHDEIADMSDDDFNSCIESGREELARRTIAKQKAEDAAREQQRLANLDEKGRLQELLQQVQAITIPEVRNASYLEQLRGAWVNEINAAIEGL